MSTTGPGDAAVPPGAPAPTGWDLDAVLARSAVVLCCGSGGVGKTTTAAALAVRAAESGRRACVLTIDPARRLAQSLGLDALDNTPRPVAGVDPSAGGSLDAMMLDMKRTFDELVTSHSDPAAAEQILANPFYRSLSSSFSGTQEYMAMEKLAQLRERADYDLVVVDTPPTRSALDFLDAPERLSGFLDGRMIRLLTAPARAGGRAYWKVLSGGVNVVTGVVARVIGAQVLRDLQLFVASLDDLFGGFRARAEETYALLAAPGTSFVVVAAPERDALREAAYFTQRLERDGMPLAGLLLNRVTPVRAPALDAAAARAAAGRLSPEALADVDGGVAAADAELAAGLLRVHAEAREQAAREAAREAEFRAAHPRVPVVRLAARARDVHRLEDLRSVGREVAEGR